MQSPEIDEDIDEGVLVGNGLFVAQFGAFDAQSQGLGVNPLVGRALVVEQFIGLRVTVELVTDTSPNSGGHGGDTAAFGPVFVVDRAGRGGGFREK